MNDLAPQFGLLGGNIGNITSGVPLGAGDPGVLAPFGVNTFNSQPLPSNWQAEIAESMDVTSNLTPLPANATLNFGNPILQQVQSITETMYRDPSTTIGVIQSHEPFVGAGTFHQGIMSSNNATNDVISGHNIASQAIQDGNSIVTGSGGMIASTDQLLTTLW